MTFQGGILGTLHPELGFEEAVNGQALKFKKEHMDQEVKKPITEYSNQYLKRL